MDTLKSMEPRDRDMLLSIEPAQRLGQIIQLNQEPRYNNSLDAIALLSSLNEIGQQSKARA